MCIASLTMLATVWPFSHGGVPPPRQQSDDSDHGAQVRPCAGHSKSQPVAIQQVADQTAAPLLSRIPESGNRSGRLPFSSHHSSISRVAPPRTPLGRVRGASFKWTHSSGTPQHKPGLTSRAFGAQSGLPPFMRSFGTENLDRSTDSIPGAEAGPNIKDHESQEPSEQVVSQAEHQTRGYVKLVIKVSILPMCTQPLILRTTFSLL